MGKIVLTPAAVVRRAALAALADRGPLDPEELAGMLVADGLALGDEPEDRVFEVLEAERVIELVDGRLVDVLALAEGLVLSHELSDAEAVTGRVALHPDLSVLEDLSDAGVALVAGAGPLRHDHDDDDEEDEGCVLTGPDGWLGLASSGDVLTVTVRDGRTNVLVGSEPLTANADAVLAVSEAFAESTEDHDGVQPEDLWSIWLEAMASDPEAFRQPQAPMRRLLADAGLEARGELVAPAGFDWDEWESLVTLEQVTRRWRLDEGGGLAWMILAKAYNDFATDDLHFPDAEREELVGGLAAMISYPRVAEAFVGEELGSGPDSDGSVAAFARHVLGAASGKAKAGPLWLCAICAERDGQTLEAEAMVSEALAANGSYIPALTDAAWYAADRGDARRAASLLRRAGVEPDDETLAVYERFARLPTVRAGRNDPCPCGSGRKYKHCHLQQAALPLTERCAFLYEKGLAFLLRGRHLRRLFEIAVALVEPEHSSLAVQEALRLPLVADAALFEGGVWDDFLIDRGPLLPTDELFLAQQWQLTDRSVFEIEEVRPGHGLVVRDIRTGDVIEVTERSGSRPLEAGELICGRVVPDGEGHQIFGGIERISLQQRDPLVELLDEEPTAVELAAWFAAAHAPPRLVNYEHEPTVLCTLTYRTDDADGAAAALDGILEPANPGEWVERIDTEQMSRTIRGFVRLNDGTITVETNSEVRADRLRSLLEASLPGLRLLDDVRVPAAEAMADGAMARLGDPPALPEGAVQFMEDFARDYERRWVDMPIPALAGLTPRQAADDPTRREDLIALLTEFGRSEPPAGTPGVTMNVDRLRDLLEMSP